MVTEGKICCSGVSNGRGQVCGLEDAEHLQAGHVPTAEVALELAKFLTTCH